MLVVYGAGSGLIAFQQGQSVGNVAQEAASALLNYSGISCCQKIFNITSTCIRARSKFIVFLFTNLFLMALVPLILKVYNFLAIYSLMSFLCAAHVVPFSSDTFGL